MNEAQAIQTGAFNLAMFEAAETGIMDVMATNGEPLLFEGEKVQIELCGPGSAEYVNVTAEIDRAQQDRLMLAVRGKSAKSQAATTREQIIKKLTACTKRLINFPIPGGASALWNNPKLGYITADAARYVDEWANFPSKSETPLSST